MYAAALADLFAFGQGEDASTGEVPPRPHGWPRSGTDATSATAARDSRVDPDAGIVPAVRAGDETAFRQLFDRYVDRLIAFAVVLIHDRAAAQDIVADVFFALWRGRTTWTPERVSTYLFGAVRNRCYNHRNSVAARRETTLDDTPVPTLQSTAATADAAIDAAALTVRIEAVLTTLPPQRRAAALLRWREEMAFSEIAQALGISENAARLHVSRALKAVRYLLPNVNG